MAFKARYPITSKGVEYAPGDIIPGVEHSPNFQHLINCNYITQVFDEEEPSDSQEGLTDGTPPPTTDDIDSQSVGDTDNEEDGDDDDDSDTDGPDSSLQVGNGSDEAQPNSDQSGKSTKKLSLKRK